MLCRMGFGMRLEQGLHLKQTISLHEHLELRQELVQKMGYHAESIRDAGPDAPDNLLQSLLDGILNALENDNFREGLRILFSDKTFRKAIIDSAESLAAPTSERIQEFVLRYLYDAHRGEFSIESFNEDGQVENTELLKTPYPRFREAFLTPDTLREKSTESEELMPMQSAEGKDVTGLMNARREMEDAFRVVEASREHIGTLKVALETVLQKRTGDNELGLSDFLRDLVVMGKLDFVLSERIQRRFVANFSHVVEKTSPEKMKNGFLNIIGEYVLVSMGIVHPDLFQLNSGVRDIPAYTDAKSALSEVGLDLDALLQKYQLQAPGTFFLNRWRTTERTPGPITDDLIRAFITETIRADAEQILDAVNYGEFFEQIRDIKTAGESKEETEDKLRAELSEVLTSEKFEMAIIGLIRNKWYAKLDMFYQRT
jgi:hypothetical protein